MIKNEGIVTLTEMRLAGSAIRTTNRTEDNPVTARIPGHWQEFRASISPAGLLGDSSAPGAKSDSPIAVYTHYESDHTGEYTHFIGYQVAEYPDNKLDRCLVPAGPYLKFSGQGEMPGIVIDTWREVWDYFEGRVPHTRGYETDFELYLEGGVEVYVSVG